MKIIHAMAGAAIGGAEGFFERLTIGLHQCGLEQKLIIRANPARTHKLTEAGLSVTEAPFGGIFDLRTRPIFRRLSGEFKPDLVLTWMNRATKLIPAGSYVKAARLGGYYDLKYYRDCDHLIGNTQGIVDWIGAQGWPRDRVHYLPNFVSAESAPPMPRADHDTPPDVPLVLALGRLHANKAFDCLLHALHAVPEAYLWLAGDGPERASLMALAAELGVARRVRFLGWQHNVAALFAAADLFVCPSRHEPLGNVVIEAWAQSCPVVATRSQGPLELIADGETGLLAALDDPKDLARAITMALQDKVLSHRLAEQGLQTYRDRFTEQAVTQHYLDFFTRVDRKKGASSSR